MGEQDGLKALNNLLAPLRATLARRHNLRAHFWQTLSNYFQHAIGLAMSVLLARILTPEDFGRFAYVAALFEILLVCIPFASGMGQILIGDGGRTPGLFDIINALVRRFIFVEAAFGVFLSCHFAVKGQPQDAVLAIGLTLFYVIGRLAAVYRCDLEARGNFKPIFLFGFWSAFLAAIFTVALALMGAGVYSLLAPPAISALIATVVFRYRFGCPYTPPTLNLATTWHFFRTSFWTWLVSVSTVVQSRADRIVIGSELSDRDLGYYNRGLNFSPLAYLTLNSFLSNAATSGYARAENDSHRFRLLAKTCALVFAFGIANFFVWWSFSDPLVPWIFGKQWVGAIPVFQALAPLSICYALRDIPSTFLLGQKRFRYFGTINLLSVVLFFGGILFMKGHLTIVTVAYILQLSMAIPGAIALGAIIASAIHPAPRN